MRHVEHLIGGKRVDSSRHGQVYDPATGEVTGEVAYADAAVVDDAVAAAHAAFPGWADTPLSRRAEVMFAARAGLAARRRELAELVTAEHGKTLEDAAGEVARGLENVEFACGVANLLKGGYSRQVSSGVDVHEVAEPLGVVAGVTPFNFPVMVPLWMVPTAIACGNTFVLKPSEKDPSASLVIAEVFAEAGLPPGVLNVVHGEREAVAALVDHRLVRAVSFVGSTPVARAIYAAGAAAGKRVQALGGAKNHMVVLADADLDTAADAAVSAGFGSAGERCMAVSVVVALPGIADDLVAAIAARVLALRVGPGMDPTSQMGPLITAEHRDKVASYVEGARADGAEVVVDGRRATLPAAGFFLGPSLLDRVAPQMAAYRDEIFGPVLSVVRARDLEAAIEIVNENPYGNGAAVFTRDGGAACRFEREVEAGMVGVNVPIPVPVAQYSFGGFKQSIFGANDIYGPDGVRFYTRRKVVTSRWPSGASGLDLGFLRPSP